MNELNFWKVQRYPSDISCAMETFLPHNAKYGHGEGPDQPTYICLCNLGPVVQSIVSLTNSLRVISLTVLADSIHNILIFFADKM